MHMATTQNRSNRGWVELFVACEYGKQLKRQWAQCMDKIDIIFQMLEKKYLQQM